MNKGRDNTGNMGMGKVSEIDALMVQVEHLVYCASDQSVDIVNFLFGHSESEEEIETPPAPLLGWANESIARMTRIVGVLTSVNYDLRLIVKCGFAGVNGMEKVMEAEEAENGKEKEVMIQECCP